MKKGLILFIASIFFLPQGAKGIIPVREYGFYPEKLGLIYRELNVTAPDGLKFFPAQEGLSEKEKDKYRENPVKREYKTLYKTLRPAIIICNGDTDCMVYTELLIDYDAVIDEVIRQKEIDIKNIAVMDCSTGAYLSMAAASKRSKISSFIGQALMTPFDEVMPIVRGLPENKGRKLIVPADYPESLVPINLAPKFDKATLLISRQQGRPHPAGNEPPYN